MSYSKKKPTKGLRWLIASWVFFFAVGAIGAGVTVNIIKKPPPTITAETQTPEPLYGTRDGRVFAGNPEMSRDWGAGDLDFKPLDVPLAESTQEFIFYLSYGYYIDFPFVMGLIQQESGFNPKAISETNDFGLMQINACNHGWLEEQLGITDILDPEQNIRAGLYILRTLFEKYDDPEKVLMAYNMGEHGANLLWEKGVYQTNHSRKALTYADGFRKELEGDGN